MLHARILFHFSPLPLTPFIRVSGLLSISFLRIAFHLASRLEPSTAIPSAGGWFRRDSGGFVVRGEGERKGRGVNGVV